MPVIAIIDYGSGNLRSAAKAFEHVANAEQSILITSNPEDLTSASHIILPGVGAFADCMQGLQRAQGMIAALETEILQHKKPFLGICVGMQMLFEYGFEHGRHQGLGWLKGDVVKIQPAHSLKIPHMGWNDIIIKQQHPLLATLPTRNHYYFVHSYHAVCKEPENMVATVNYGSELTAIVAKDNIMGTQFHPEKSQESGLAILRSFLSL